MNTTVNHRIGIIIEIMCFSIIFGMCSFFFIYPIINTGIRYLQEKKKIHYYTGKPNGRFSIYDAEDGIWYVWRSCYWDTIATPYQRKDIVLSNGDPAGEKIHGISYWLQMDLDRIWGIKRPITEIQYYKLKDAKRNYAALALTQEEYEKGTVMNPVLIPSQA